MGRRHSNRSQDPQPQESWGMERTLADVEADVADSPQASSESSCPCGSNEFLLEAYLQVVDGRPRPEPVEVESLTCPQCGREFEAVQTEDGRVLRGELLGYVELED